ncbi:MAG: type II toxin-antitoxin system CcdA family antitoxin [Paracoccaceae bacterium]
MQPQRRKPTNLSLDRALLSEARALKVNLSRAAEDGVRVAVVEARELSWKAKNTKALKSSNAYVEENGLPLEQFRQF